MLPLLLIAVGVGVLVSCDSPRPQRRETGSGGSSPAPPPPPPPADSGSTPRGVNPALFRPTPPALGPIDFPTAEQVQTELAGLFQRGYALNARGELIVTRQTDADALQRRLGELRDIAFRDPRAAERYDRREITKYVYLTLASFRPAERGLLLRLDTGRLSAADAVRQLDREEIEFVERFRGRGDPLEDPFHERHRQLGFAMREILSPEAFAQAARTSARSVVDGSDLLNDSDGELRAKFLLRQAPPGELRLVARYLSGNRASIDQALWADPVPTSMPALLRDVRALLRHGSEADSRRIALEMTTYISFVLTVQGTTSLERDLIEECRTEFRLTDESACSLRAGLRLADESPDEFDNARMRPQLIEHLGRFYADTLGRTPAQRLSQQGLLLEGELGQALMGGRFGPPFTSSELQAVLADVRRQLGATHVPPERGIPLTWDEIHGIGDTPIEVRPEDLPTDLRDLAGRITISVPRGSGQAPWEGTLLDYLRQNVEVVVFTRHIPTLSDAIGDPEATVNRLFRTVIVDIDGRVPAAGAGDKPMYEILSTLAHEAYHNDYFHNLVPNDPRLSRATAVNERNAHLLEARVLQEILRLHLPEARALMERVSQGGEEAVRTMTAADRRRFIEFFGAGDAAESPEDGAPPPPSGEINLIPPLYASHRLIGLSANAPLEYELTGERAAGLSTRIFPEIRIETLGRYPTAYTADYLRMRGLTQEQFLSRAQDELFTALGLERNSRRTTRRPRTATH